MSKFCTKCGRPIPEGGICSCQLQTGMKNTENQVGSQQPAAGGNQPSKAQAGNPHVQQNMQMPLNHNNQQQSQGQQFQNQQQFQGQQFQNQQQFQGQQFQNQRMSQNRQFPNQQFDGQQYKEQASAFAQNFFGRMLHLIKNPVTAGRNLILEADMKTAFLLIAFQGIFSAFFAMAAAGKLSGYIQAASGLAEGISSGLGNVVAGVLSMPYFRIFLVTVLFSIGMACVLALMLMAGHFALKMPVSFPQMISAAAIRSAVLVPAILLSIVIFELSAGMGIALFVLINIWGFTAMLAAMYAFVRPEKMDFFVLMVSIIILFFVVLAVFVFTKAWTLYLPDLTRTAIKGMGGISWQQILEELM